MISARFYPRLVLCDKFEYYEVYDCLKHRVLESTSDYFDALERCHKYSSCGFSEPIQLSLDFK